jgi:hypothetical protein
MPQAMLSIGMVRGVTSGHTREGTAIAGDRCAMVGERAGVCCKHGSMRIADGARTVPAHARYIPADTAEGESRATAEARVGFGPAIAIPPTPVRGLDQTKAQSKVAPVFRYPLPLAYKARRQVAGSQPTRLRLLLERLRFDIAGTWVRNPQTVGVRSIGGTSCGTRRSES